MNILLITHIFSPAVDGGSRVINKVGEYLYQEGHQISVLTSNCSSTDDFVNPKSKPIVFNQKNKYFSKIFRLPVYKNLRRPLKLIEIILTKIFLVNPNSYLIGLLKTFQKGPIFKLIPFIKCLFYLNQQNLDLIITGPLPTTIVLYATFINKFFKTRLLINPCFHQTDPDFFRKPLIKSLKKSDYIWSLTQYEKDYFIKNLKLKSSKIILAGNGVDPNFLINSSKIKYPKNPNLLFIGSLSQHKRVELLIKSFSQIFSKNPNVSLTIAGQKTLYYPQIERYLKTISKEIKSKINFEFNFSQAELTKLIDNCTVLVLPSVQESFGLVLIESWARGKPVVVSSIPSLSELVKKTNGGCIFSSDSSESLIKQINKLLDNPDLCQTLGKNGLKYVKNNYTWPQVTQKLCQNIF